MDYISSNTYLAFWIGVIGLCLGSFFNVVILRSLSDESIVFPPSKCPKCNHKLYFWHNIPVLSYILLRGKCYFCKEKISIQYPLIEILTSVLFLLSFYKFGLSAKFLFAIIVISCLIIMSMTDLKEKLVDCNIAIGLGVFGIIYNFFINSNLKDSLLGLIAGIIIIELISLCGYIFTKKRAMGLADTYVAGALGACFGLQQIGLILSYAIVSYLFFLIPMFFYKQYKANNILTCIWGILFTLSCLIYTKLAPEIWMFVVLLIFALLLIFEILKSLSNPQTEKTYLPFVPAFSIAILYILFF